MNVLDRILAHKADELRDAKARRSAAQLARDAAAVTRPVAGLARALATCDGVAVIAEIKRMSPSKGLIRADFDAEKIALAYQAAGAAGISVLTDEKFFGGSLEILRQVRAAVATPLLRKDFVIDPYQIDEARVAGADAVLLIVAALSDPDLDALHRHAVGLGLDVLVEVHDESELERALAIGAKLVGVNNRDLRSFEVDLGTTERLAARIADPAVLLVAESGIGSPEDVARLARAGARGFLVGESLMRQPDPGQALAALRRRS
ncbi:MAG: indole-3-glycerol phosphate synthase TrpC [Deltaproteobacteria bacterium]|nr:indole-3-glycerol phosphate synthase TrpC [Deltaproteobacteria bacterium]